MPYMATCRHQRRWQVVLVEERNRPRDQRPRPSLLLRTPRAPALRRRTQLPAASGQLPPLLPLTPLTLTRCVLRSPTSAARRTSSTSPRTPRGASRTTRRCSRLPRSTTTRSSCTTSMRSRRTRVRLGSTSTSASIRRTTSSTLRWTTRRSWALRTSQVSGARCEECHLRAWADEWVAGWWTGLSDQDQYSAATYFWWNKYGSLTMLSAGIDSLPFLQLPPYLGSTRVSDTRALEIRVLTASLPAEYWGTAFQPSFRSGLGYTRWPPN